MRSLYTLFLTLSSIIIFGAHSSKAQEALTTLLFDPVTLIVEEIPFEATSDSVTALDGVSGTATEPVANEIELALLEAFTYARATTAPHADTIQPDTSLDVPFGIIGQDDRVRVSPTNGFPARALTHISFATANSYASYCSGSLIAPDTVLTAGHCVFQSANGGWNTGYRVLPGRNGPLMHFEVCGVTTVLTLKGWVENEGRPKDLAALKLDCDVGTETGYLSMKTTPSARDMSLILQGYPGEAKLLGLQLQSTDKIRSLHSFSFDHEADTTGGMSGSPVLDDAGAIIGVHTATTKGEDWSPDNQVGVVNHATRITEHRLALVQSWIEM